MSYVFLTTHVTPFIVALLSWSPEWGGAFERFILPGGDKCLTFVEEGYSEGLETNSTYSLILLANYLITSSG